jgi:hypothetical protein
MALFIKFGASEISRIRHAFNGAIFAIRIFAGLERLGVRFSDKYPPQTRRIEQLNEIVLALSPSLRFFHEISTIVVAYQDMLDSVEAEIDASLVMPAKDGDRILVRFISELEEVAHGRLSEKSFISDVICASGRMSVEIIPYVINKLNEYYRGESIQEGYIPEDLGKKMGEALAYVIPALPTHLKKMFR